MEYYKVEVIIVDYYNGAEVITIDYVDYPMNVRGGSENTTVGNQSQCSLDMEERNQVKDPEIQKRKEEFTSWQEEVSSLHAKLDKLIDLVASQYQHNLKDEKGDNWETTEFDAGNCGVELEIHQKVVEESP